MGKQVFQFENDSSDMNQIRSNPAEKSNTNKRDEDLIIEENTVYEIDRECYERLKRQRRRKNPEKKNV